MVAFIFLKVTEHSFIFINTCLQWVLSPGPLAPQPDDLSTMLQRPICTSNFLYCPLHKVFINILTINYKRNQRFKLKSSHGSALVHFWTLKLALAVQIPLQAICLNGIFFENLEVSSRIFFQKKKNIYTKKDQHSQHTIISKMFYKRLHI